MQPGKKIRDFRKKKGLNQIEFGKKLGYSQKFVSDIEIGKAGPSREFLKKLNEVFDISSDYILYGNISDESSSKQNLISVMRERTSSYEIAAHKIEKRQPENTDNRKIITKVLKILNSGNTKAVKALKANIEAFLMIVKGGD